MPEVTNYMIPLISINFPSDYPKLKFWHDSRQIIFPVDSTTTLNWAPPTGKLYIVFAITYGRVRDYVTENEILTTLFGFYHKHDPSEIYHWNPALESVLDHIEPHYAEVETGNPLEFTFYNNTVYQIIFDFTLWFYEVDTRDIDTVRQYFRGLYNLAMEKGVLP